jgi:BolA protein
MSGVAKIIKEKLGRAFEGANIEIVDDSHRHAGHAGASVGGESHFNLSIEAAEFAGMGRIARQRLVLGLLAEELAGPVHALSLKLRAPGEA